MKKNQKKNKNRLQKRIDDKIIRKLYGGNTKTVIYFLPDEEWKYEKDC